MGTRGCCATLRFTAAFTPRFTAVTARAVTHAPPRNANHAPLPPAGARQAPQARAVATERRHRRRAAAGRRRPRKLLHIVRHAEGFHNTERKHVAERSHDARLTPNGEAQCAALRAALGELAAFSSPSLLVVASPLTRTLQTASLCFPGARIVALEEVRETCNFRCDGRRNLELIRPEFPHVDFSKLRRRRRRAVGALRGAPRARADAYRGHREPDLPGLAARAARARAWLAARPEPMIVVVTHCAFLQAVLGPRLDGRDGRPPPAFDADDHEVGGWLAAPFANCEMRSVFAEF